MAADYCISARARMPVFAGRGDYPDTCQPATCHGISHIIIDASRVFLVDGINMIRSVLSSLFTPYQAIILITLAGIAMLAAAYGFQYLGGLQPCTMCYWQRIPHAVVIGIGVLTFWFGQNTERGFLIIAGLVMAVSTGLGFWHAGVEWGILAGPTGCSGGIDFGGNASAVLDNLLATKPVRCDEVPWSFIRVSMAGWNFIISLTLSAYAFLTAYANR
jgi:disulfide bond formation protein DsbB